MRVEGTSPLVPHSTLVSTHANEEEMNQTLPLLERTRAPGLRSEAPGVIFRVDETRCECNASARMTLMEGTLAGQTSKSRLSVAPDNNAYESRAEGRASGEPVTRDTGKQATQRRRRQRTHTHTGTAPEPSSERGSSNKTGNTLTTSDVDAMKTPASLSGKDKHDPKHLSTLVHSQ
jgi:hypothetical protein